MKKVVILFILLIFNSPVFAAEWQAYMYKGWYDISSYERNNNIVVLWFKDLNDGNWDLINNIKPWYHLIKLKADCNNRKFIIQSSTYYDIKGKPIDSYTFSTHTYYAAGRYYVDNGWTDIIPDSVGEAKYELMCNL